MFIELTEILRCPRDHSESYMVTSPIAMDGRRVVRGVIGCPECKTEFPIVDGVAYFGTAGARAVVPAARSAVGDYGAAALASFLNLGSPGGYAVLVGAAGRLGPAIAAELPGIHFVAVNPPPGVAPSAALSVLQAGSLPFKSSSVRGVALGADHAGAEWLADGARILLSGLRLVAEDERARAEGISELARGAGLFVGAKSR